MRFKKWNIGTPAERDVALLRSAGYPYLLSTVLAARGVTTAEAAAEALERDRSLSMSPMLMRDMDKAVARIQRAISQGETIAVFGDYDVDGITSTVLLMDYLKSCGVRCLRHIPRRIEEGYGLSKEAIQGLRDQGWMWSSPTIMSARRSCRGRWQWWTPTAATAPIPSSIWREWVWR